MLACSINRGDSMIMSRPVDVPMTDLDAWTVEDVSNRLLQRMPDGYTEEDWGYGDCAVRSFALLLNQPYQQTLQEIADFAENDPKRGVNIKIGYAYLAQHGYKMFAPRDPFSGRMPRTARVIADGLLEGFKVELSLCSGSSAGAYLNDYVDEHHSICVDDGIVYDQTMDWLNTHVLWIVVHEDDVDAIKDALFREGIALRDVIGLAGNRDVILNDMTAGMVYEHHRFVYKTGVNKPGTVLHERKVIARNKDRVDYLERRLRQQMAPRLDGKVTQADIDRLKVAVGMLESEREVDKAQMRIV